VDIDLDKQVREGFLESCGEDNCQPGEVPEQEADAVAHSQAVGRDVHTRMAASSAAGGTRSVVRKAETNSSVELEERVLGLVVASSTAVLAERCFRKPQECQVVTLRPRLCSLVVPLGASSCDWLRSRCNKNIFETIG